MSSRLILSSVGLNRSQLSVLAKRHFTANVWSRASSVISGTLAGVVGDWPESQHVKLVSSPETALGAVASSEFLDRKPLATPTTNEAKSRSWVHDHVEFISSPETALGEVAVSEYLNLKPCTTTTNEGKSHSWVQDHVQFVSSPETALGEVAVSEFLNQKTLAPNTEAKTHSCVQDQREFTSSPETALRDVAVSEFVKVKPITRADTLPTRLEEIHEDSTRAMVITSAQEPFEIVDVNDAWVGLCGYTREESRSKSLGSLLQGPDTNHEALQQFISSLVAGQEAQVEITNYTKQGRKFINHVRAGSIQDGNHNRYFVGILQEVYADSMKVAAA